MTTISRRYDSAYPDAESGVAQSLGTTTFPDQLVVYARNTSTARAAAMCRRWSNVLDRSDPVDAVVVVTWDRGDVLSRCTAT